MSKLTATLIALSLLAPLSACQQAKGPDNATIIVDYDDYEDYEYWKKERAEDAKAQPFKPALLEVTGTGTVKATPDIAVITGTIKATGDYDHRVVDETAIITNKIQEIIAGQDVRLSFTRINASEQRDPACLRHNAEARARHNQIRSDNWYNKRLLQNKDSKEKPRKDKARIAEKVCPVTHIDGYVAFTAWVRPVEMAGDILNDFTEAGVTTVDLYGYDFSDYDALYKQASAMAVKNAKAKALMAAKTAGTQLTTLEQFYVDAPQRVSRFGPQAMVISNHGNRHVAAGRYRNTQESVLTGGGWSGPAPQAVISPAPPPQPAPIYSEGLFDTAADEVVVTGSRRHSDRFNSSGSAGSGGQYRTVTETIVVQEASTELVSIPTTFETVYENGIARRVVKTPASTVERMIPAVTKSVTRRVPINAPAQSSGPTYVGHANNALRMTLLAGPQTVQVNATLGYLYETPLNGKVIIDED